MNQSRPSQRTKTSNWRNSTITTTIIIIIITIMLGADMSMMSPASSWCLPGTDTVTTTIIIIIIITASTAATIKVALHRTMKNRTSRVLFFVA